MGKYYALRDELNQKMMYSIIYNAEQYRYNVSIETDIEKLSISETDEDTLDTFESWCEIAAQDSVYKKIGFLLMENIKIEKISILKDKVSMSVYPNSVYSSNSLDEIRKTLMDCRLNSNWWIVGELMPNGEIVPVGGLE